MRPGGAAPALSHRPEPSLGLLTVLLPTARTAAGVRGTALPLALSSLTVSDKIKREK